MQNGKFTYLRLVIWVASYICNGYCILDYACILCLLFDGREFLPFERRQYCILCYLSVKSKTLLEGSPFIGIKVEVLGKPRKMSQRKVEERVDVLDRTLSDVCEEL